MILFEKKFNSGLFSISNERPEGIFLLKQTHSSIVLPLETQENTQHQVEGDGVYWNWEHDLEGHQMACVQTADCIPLLILGENGGALVHAGWRGVQQSIFLAEQIQKIKPYYFFIAPSIQQKSYEVGKEFIEYFPDSKAFTKFNGRLYFSIQEETKNRILKHYPRAVIEDSNICTFENKQYNSYRREKLTKRNWNTFSILKG
jgi:copper oxidase (laccase) domain-containing protein